MTAARFLQALVACVAVCLAHSMAATNVPSPEMTNDTTTEMTNDRLAMQIKRLSRGLREVSVCNVDIIDSVSVRASTYNTCICTCDSTKIKILSSQVPLLMNSK